MVSTKMEEHIIIQYVMDSPCGKKTKMPNFASPILLSMSMWFLISGSQKMMLKYYFYGAFLTARDRKTQHKNQF